MSSKSKPKVEKNLEEGPSEDEDVRMEKARVKEALSCQACEEVREELTWLFWWDPSGMCSRLQRPRSQETSQSLVSHNSTGFK